MKNLIDYALKEKYEKVKKLRSKLEEMKNLIDWEALLPLFPDKETNMGRPEYEKKLMLKILFLQGCYGLSDQEMEIQLYDRLSFQQFLDFPKDIPDFSTIWRFRDMLTKGEISELIWTAIQKQIAAHGIRIKKGVVQDATFIHADPGKKNSGMNGRGREAKTSRSKDGSWTQKGSKKNKKNIFGFKAHHKTDLKTKIITEMAMTTAKTHDGKIDLAKPDEINNRDRGYSGCHTKAKGDATMKKGNLNIRQKLRNKRIAKKRCRGEHPYGTMKRSFKAGFTKLTTLPRVYVQHMFVCIAYNIHRTRFLLT